MTAEWIPGNEYYWIGPPGWQICRVYVPHKWVFELWRTGPDGKIVAFADSLAEAAAKYEELRDSVAS